MFGIIPFALWLKWAAIICLISGFYLYFRTLHTRHGKWIAKDRARHALAGQVNAAYARMMHLLWVPLAMITMAYIVQTDMVLHQHKRQIQSLSQAVAESRRAEESALNRLAALQSATEEPVTEATLDVLKEKYELLFINHYILRKCGLHGQPEYNRLNSLFKEETRALALPAPFHRNMLSAAKGSFDELYAAIPCDSAHVRSLSTRMAAFLQNAPSQ